jgi:hypothetical protein
LSLRNQSLTLLTLPQPLYTVDRRESAVVLIRIWLCSASRVQQPNRPVSGIPASRAFYAILNNRLEVEANPNHTGRRLTTWRRVGCRSGRPVPAPPHAGPPQRYPIEIPTLTQTLSNHRAPYHPRDASCKKGLQDASQNPDPRTQPIEKEELKRS